MHLSDISSIAQHLKNVPVLQLNFRKFLPITTIVEQQNSKQRLQILEALHIRKKSSNLNKINFETNANILGCL